MEWIGTGFVLTVGTVRLRVRIALEDTPRDGSRQGKAAASAREQRGDDRPRRRTYRVHPR